jgi:hypothetical protein
MGAKELKVLSLPQPWATLVVTGLKRTLLQPFDTAYRGVVQIHANKIMDCGMKAEERNQFLLTIQGVAPDIPSFRDMEFGSIIGQVELADVLPALPAPDSVNDLFCSGAAYDPEREKLLRDYISEGYYWVLTNPVLFECPLQSKKRRKYWSWR